MAVDDLSDEKSDDAPVAKKQKSTKRANKTQPPDQHDEDDEDFDDEDDEDYDDEEEEDDYDEDEDDDDDAEEDDDDYEDDEDDEEVESDEQDEGTDENKLASEDHESVAKSSVSIGQSAAYKHVQMASNDANEGDTAEKRPRVLWKKVQQNVQDTQVSISSVLKAFGALPTGFRPSTMSELAADERHRMRQALMPRLSKTGLLFSDLVYDVSSRLVKARLARINRLLSFVAVLRIPALPEGIACLQRYARLALYDQETCISNVHTIIPTADGRDPSRWLFNSKLTDDMTTVDYSDVFVRNIRQSDSLSAVVELAMTIERTRTKEATDVSCGWVSIPLVDPVTGQAIGSKSFDLLLNGGSIFERGVEVDPTIAAKASSQRFFNMLSKGRQPRIEIKVSVPSRDLKEQLDCLPDVLVGSVAHVPLYHLYRYNLARLVLQPGNGMIGSTQPIFSPFLATFPGSASYYDFMDLLRRKFLLRLKGLTRAEKKDLIKVSTMFETTYKDYIFPLVCCSSLAPLDVSKPEALRERQREINRLVQIRDAKHSTVAMMCAMGSRKPLDYGRLTFSVVDQPVLV